jgi:hypothetical protein
MLRRIRRRRDPFWDDGVGARGRRQRYRIEGMLAFGLAVVACGLTAAIWIRELMTLMGQLAIH